MDDLAKSLLIDQLSKQISEKFTRSDKIAWERKIDKMVKIHANLIPVEEKILDLLAIKQPLIEEIQSLRTTLVRNCIHPKNYLVCKVLNGVPYVECKFCNTKFANVIKSEIEPLESNSDEES